MSARGQSGYILIVLLFVVVLVGGGVAFLFTSQSLKKIQTYNRRLEQAAAEPSVVLTAEYENPFDKQSEKTTAPAVDESDPRAQSASNSQASIACEAYEDATALAVELHKKTQYTNPFSTYKNPFDSF